MKKQANFNNLLHFFKSAYENREVCPTEVENFLQEYLKYIFDLNKLDMSRYDISIQKVCLDEVHSKRAHEFKRECNQEDRKREKTKTLTKRGYNAYCANDYFDALMRPSQTIKNKYDIFINQNVCRARNEKEIGSLIYFFQVFGHEVHYIIQYIRHVQEMDRYDELLAINDINLKNASCYYEPRDARKIKRLIHQHLSAIYANCKSELYADKKGYDYLDILFNEILSSLPTEENKKISKQQLEKIKKFSYFIKNYQEINKEFYLDRIPYYKEYKQTNEKACKRLEEFGYNGDDLVLD